MLHGNRYLSKQKERRRRLLTANAIFKENLLSENITGILEIFSVEEKLSR
jgi:hypothetical protein